MLFDFFDWNTWSEVETKMTETKSILDNFIGTECAGCGKYKPSKMSHCRRCYFKLPKYLRDPLYKPFGGGYEEAFRASVRFLNRLKQESREATKEIQFPDKRFKD